MCRWWYAHKQCWRQSLSEKRTALKNKMIIENAPNGLNLSIFEWRKRESHASIGISQRVYLWLSACERTLPCQNVQKFWIATEKKNSRNILRWVDCFSSKHPWKRCVIFSELYRLVRCHIFIISATDFFGIRGPNFGHLISFYELCWCWSKCYRFIYLLLNTWSVACFFFFSPYFRNIENA